MKKIYLKDLSREELFDLCIKNDNFMEQFYERVQEDNMFWQEEESNNMFGKEWHRYIDCHDNYDSFYLRLRDWYKFISNLDSDYLCSEGLELYKYIMKKKKIFDSMTQYTDRYDNLEEHLENTCADLLEICEGQLHEYEKYPSFDEVFDAMYDCEWQLEKDYYTDEKHEKVYLDVAYTKTF